ncbi:MAG: hypothetical protein WCX31_14595 [Salinivirgaceae bacterium]|jgi:hypothetical protein
MKNLILIFSVFLIFSACKKDEIGFDKTDLLGSWEELNIDPTEICTNYIKFSDEVYYYTQDCGSNSSTSSGSYSFDGKNIILNGVTQEIIFLNTEFLKVRVANSYYTEIKEYKKP